MKMIGLFLLAFVLGWSGAVWSYSDQIYSNSNIESQNKTK